MLHLIMSVAVLVVGLLVALVLEVPPDLRVFGWVLVAVGVLGLVARFAIARYQASVRPPDGNS